MENKNNYHRLKKENNKSNQKNKKVYETHVNKYLKKEKYIDSSHSNKYNDIMNMHNFDKISLNRDIKSKNLTIINSKYKKDLFEKFYEFLNKNKFKLSNNFDEKHSKKFLDKKNKCLERIKLSDIIENENSNKNNLDKNNKHEKAIQNKKSFNKYFIIISNYDEELKFKNSKKKKCKY